LVSFPGRFNDGWTAQRHQVEVTFRPAGLEIRDTKGSLLALWAAEDVHLTEPLDGRREARLRRGFEEPARLVVDGDAALAALKDACPNLNKTERSGWRYWRTAALWSAAAIDSVVLLFTVVIPTFSEQIARNLPETWTARIGLEARQQIIAALAGSKARDGSDVVCRGEDGLRALDGLVEALLLGVPDPPAVTVTVLDVDLANAFALPGGQILVMRGLIDRTDEPNALAGVVAHELGHVLDRHPLAVAIERASTAVFLGLLLGDATGGTMIAGVGHVLLGNAYSRDAEREADAIGLDLMGRAGFDARPLGPFLTSLGGADGTWAAFLSTHPLSEERARTIERAAAGGGPAISAADWRAVRAVCG